MHAFGKAYGNIMSLLYADFADQTALPADYTFLGLFSGYTNLIGSSNLRDIRAYCEEKQITYLTTIDFLWYAWKKGMLTPAEISAFIAEVKQKGSKLPEVEIEKYVCDTIL